MVNIDTVYQRVLALANKEQRGYITPQEFNLFANQSQLEIFEQYFYDLNNFELRDAAYTINEDVTDLTRQKMDIFLMTAGVNLVNSWQSQYNAIILPDYVYRISRVEALNKRAEYLDNNKFNDAITAGPLIKPTNNTPIWTQHNGRIKIHNGVKTTSGIGMHYYMLPSPVSWGYFVVQSKALYDSSNTKTKHFQLHSSEETELIYKILRLAGISMKRDDVLKAGQGLDSLQTQKEKQ